MKVLLTGETFNSKVGEMVGCQLGYCATTKIVHAASDCPLARRTVRTDYPMRLLLNILNIHIG